MNPETTSTQCEVSIAGAPLDPLVGALLVSVEVDSTMFVPSQFRLVFQGVPDDVLIPGGLQLATPITVSASNEAAPIPLITGEVTAVEVEYALGETRTIVRGMDMCHRLMRGTNTMSYPEAIASEVVAGLLAEAAVPPGEVMATSVVYPWLTQANVSNWVFIQQLAALSNYVAYSDALGLFNFCPMPEPEAGEPPVLTYDQPPMGTQLVMGINLLRLRAVVTTSEQVPAVTVTGYDPMMAAPVVGLMATLPSTSQSEDFAVLPPTLAGEMEADPFFDSSRPFDDQSAAELWASSIGADIAGAMAEVEAECVGNPSLLAGESVTIGMAGLPFDGYYICTAARHVFDSDNGGYTTWLTVGGFQDRSLFALSSGAAPLSRTRPTVAGLVIGTVVDNEDPAQLGQVKVMFPWLDPDYISAWARVMQIGATKDGGGFLWVPEIGDEVLLGFDRGDIDHPYVIGGLYNGVTMPIPPPAIEAGAVSSRRIVSGTGHTIQWNDGPEAVGISIMTAPAESAPTSIVLDGDEVKITISSDGQISITGQAGITISSEGPLSLDGTEISIGSSDTTSLSLAGAEISMGSAETTSVMLSSSGEVNVSGSMISLGGG
jgi:phage protein D